MPLLFLYSSSIPTRISKLCSFKQTLSRSFLCSSVSSDMDASAGLTLYPLHRSKTLHLVRHAQGVHNVEGEKDHNAYLSYDLFDAHLTPLGWKQVDNLRKHVQACGLSNRIDLVIVSPLLRTMQTAVGVFGGEASMDGVKTPPLMVENAGNSDHSAISSLNCPQFIAVELCREHWGVHPCDKRRSIRELWTRKEKEIAIVTHSGFLYHTLSAFGNDCHPSVKSEICTHFANCELRSVVIVDRSLEGSDTSVTNYPGNLPPGFDLPSDVAEDKHPEKALT